MSNLGQALLIPAKGSSFDPRSLGSLKLWLDATNIGLADTTAVSTWTDKSGLGNNVTQAVGGNQPTYRVAGLNSRPSVRFAAASSHFMNVPAIDLTGTSALSVYVVFFATAGALYTLLENGVNSGAGTTRFGLFRLANNKVEWGGAGNAGPANFDSTATVTTTAAQASGTWDKTLAAAEALAWVNGNGAGTNPGNNNSTNAFGNEVSYIGARAGTSLFLDGDIAELAVYSVAHSDATRVSVQNYLKTKWGTP